MKRNKSKIVSIFALTVLFIATLFAFSTNATDESIYDFAKEVLLCYKVNSAVSFFSSV